MLTVALAGNPNCGKTTLFNALAGVRQRTGNWPGVTVEKKEGRLTLQGEKISVIDLPGIYSLDVASPDEQIAKNYLLSASADVFINVVDASNLERNLYLSVQLRETGIPQVIALNMIDVARRNGLHLDTDTLAQKIGCPVIPVCAVTGEGMASLKTALHLAARQLPGPLAVDYGPHIGQALETLALSDNNKQIARWQWVSLLEERALPQDLPTDALELAQSLRKELKTQGDLELDLHVADARYDLAHELSRAAIRQRNRLGRSLTDTIDRVALGRFTGIPLFLLVMYLMFIFTIHIGSAFIDFFDGFAGAIFVDGLAHLMRTLALPEWLIILCANGAGGGLQVVATFIPIVGCLYLFLSAIEDSGYIARAAFVMERFMRRVGLPGKAIVPLIVGFGCNVPAVMATRTLEDPTDRRLATLMSPFMSCGARLPVYVLFTAAFFPATGGSIVFLLYLIGIGAAIATGYALRQTLLPGDAESFVMELPPYHLPTLRGMLLRTWDRLRVFVRGAGRVIIAMVLVLNVLQSVGTDGTFGERPISESVLGTASRALTPLFSPMGLEKENWPATVGIFTGILAKEAVVGTLDHVYGALGAPEEKSTADLPFDLGRALRQAGATIPENLAGLAGALLDPLGIGAIHGDTTIAANDLQVEERVFGAMAARFDGRAGAFAYLLFILLYFPCAAMIGAVYRETGAAWAMFTAAWTTGIAYGAATFFYQAATFNAHPMRSLLWIAFVLLAIPATLALLRRQGQRNHWDKAVASPQNTVVTRECH